MDFYIASSVTASPNNCVKISFISFLPFVLSFYGSQSYLCTVYLYSANKAVLNKIRAEFL